NELNMYTTFDIYSSNKIKVMLMIISMVINILDHNSINKTRFINDFQRILNLLNLINPVYKDLITSLLFSTEDLKVIVESANKNDIQYLIENNELMPSKYTLIIK